MSFSERLAAVEARIAEACARVGRPRESVELIAVSKLQPVEAIRPAYEAGLRHFGENYAQELRDKHQACADLTGLFWHAIGPVQVKNAKYIARAAHAFHALDSVEVAQELDRRRAGQPLECFIEVNLSGEASKHGVAANEVSALAENVARLKQLRLIGLMTLPPLERDPRPYFEQLKKLAQSLSLASLSMGTTADFEQAIEAGATHVRVGTALFGPRPG